MSFPEQTVSHSDCFSKWKVEDVLFPRIKALVAKVREILDGVPKRGEEIQTFWQISLFRK